MSLTAVLRDSCTVRHLNTMIHKPDVLPSVPPLVERGQAHPGTMGTAFELLMLRGLMWRQDIRGRVRAPDRGVELLRSRNSPFSPKTSRLLGNMLAADSTMMFSPFVPTKDWDTKARRAWRLAIGTSFFRASIWWEGGDELAHQQIFSKLPEGVADELGALHDLVPWEVFEPNKRFVVNPEFGDGTLKLWGADADLVVDDMLIDIKTKSRCGVGIKDIRQLVCYALLANRFGLNGQKPYDSIKRVGVYMARVGELRVFDLRECIGRRDEKRVLQWLLGFYANAMAA